LVFIFCQLAKNLCGGGMISRQLRRLRLQPVRQRRRPQHFTCRDGKLACRSGVTGGQGGKTLFQPLHTKLAMMQLPPDFHPTRAIAQQSHQPV
jgi:hypothetical protein